MNDGNLTWRRVRPAAMPVIGLAVALAFLWPYLVMLLDAFRPSGDDAGVPAAAGVEVDDVRGGRG